MGEPCKFCNNLNVCKQVERLRSEINSYVNKVIAQLKKGNDRAQRAEVRTCSILHKKDTASYEAAEGNVEKKFKTQITLCIQNAQNHIW